MSYKKLEIWERARDFAIAVHRMTLTKLPKFEMYEQGSQIRRAAHSIRSNIVEGYGRRRYKQDFIKHLTYALASCDETTDHLEALWDTESLTDKVLFEKLKAEIDTLGRKLNLFTQSVEREHQTTRPLQQKNPAPRTQPVRGIQHRVSSIQHPSP